MERNRALWWTLRVGAALCFIGHGAFGVITKEAWIPFFGLIGIGHDTALALMPVIGAVDILAGCLLLLSPRPFILLYMALWAIWTAALRPLTGDSIFEMLERAGNYGVPLAMLLMCRPTASWRDWFAEAVPRPMTPAHERTLRSVLLATLALLLAGHGALGVGGKPGLASHYAALGLSPDAAGAAAPLIGSLELMLVALLLLRPSVSTAIAILGWKLATESLWLVDGAPVWEFVERAGSYAAAAALAILAVPDRRVIAARWRRSVGSRLAAVTLLGVAASLAIPAGVQAQENAPARWTQLDDRSLVRALRAGGLVLACRHGITDDKDDSGPTRELQRNLTEEGRRQSIAMGRAIRAARIGICPVLSSPMFRTRETAELAFGDSAVAISKLLARGKVPAEERLRLFTEDPPEGKNRVLMTHQGPLYGILTMFKSPEIGEGDCVILRPGDDATFEVIGKLSPADWERLAKL